MIPNELLDQFAETIATKVVAKLDTGRPVKRLLTAKEAAEYIGRSTGAVQHLIARQELPTVRNGRRVHVDIEDLEKWIERNKES